ncbi:MAG TPA: hypothetical protein VHQ91_02565 [Geminicoccaceae bacterium]|jgi:hypothetical protein|nr:hypothetical protein [Geminicoccaceae bacterium]
MLGFDRFEHDDAGIVFRDLMTLALCGFVVCVILIMPHINPPVTKVAQESSNPPGNVIVEVRWPDELDCDVDLWVEAPGDRPVGYSNKGGLIFNLLRDDLGKRADATGMNYEVSYSRGIPAGEYTVNVHLYRNTSGVFPIPVTIVTSVKKSAKESARQLLASKVELTREGEELTVYRFRLSAEGDLVPGSVHSLQRNLRAWRAS